MVSFAMMLLSKFVLNEKDITTVARGPSGSYVYLIRGKGEYLPAGP